jgi:hypothetical protein
MQYQQPNEFLRLTARPIVAPLLDHLTHQAQVCLNYQAILERM